MEIKKINVDRKPLETEYIQSKQDFQHVLANYKKAHIPVFKQPLFYGVIGFASLAALMTVSVFNINPEENEKIITSKTTNPQSSFKNEGYNQETTFGETEDANSLEVAKINFSEQKLVEKENSVKLETQNIEATVEVRSEKKVSSTPSNFPHISGISEGAITVSELCNNLGILMGNGMKIVSFKFQYLGGGTEKLISVSGNKIPSSVCDEMSKSNIDQLIFITDIEAESVKGVVNAPSMNLWISSKG